MQSFAMWPRWSNAFIFPDKYNDRKPRPAKDTASSRKIPFPVSKIVSLLYLARDGLLFNLEGKE